MLLALVAAAVLACAGSPEGASYTVERDLGYGPHARNTGDLYRPASPGPHPAVLLIHGGSWRRGDRSQMERIALRFVRAGYAAFNVDYRLAPEHRFPAQLEDVRAALGWLRGHASEHDVDAARIAAMGYSAGGHLALLLGLAEGEGPPPAAVASGAGPTDLRAYPKSPVIRELIGGPLDEAPDTWALASPVTHVSAGDPPVVLYHGALDAIVGIEQSRTLLERLRAHGVTSDLFEQPWSGHATAFLFDADAFGAVRGFFDRHLR